jgi:single-strand DNA-binding protein
MNLNKIFILGNITRDPETRSLPSGQPVANFGLATNRMWKDQSGTAQKKTEFHNVVLFGRLAEIAQQYLKRGSLVMIEGRVQTRSWQGQDGSTKYRTEVVGENMQMGPRSSSGSTGSSQANSDQQESQQQPAEQQVDTVEYPDDEIKPDDIPF